MEEPVVPLQIAAEHYRDAMRRGHNYGMVDFQQKAIKLLTEMAETSPFDQDTLRGIKVAMRAVKEMKVD